MSEAQSKASKEKWKGISSEEKSKRMAKLIRGFWDKPEHQTPEFRAKWAKRLVKARKKKYG